MPVLCQARVDTQSWRSRTKWLWLGLVCATCQVDGSRRACGRGEPSRYPEAGLLWSLCNHAAPSQAALPCSPRPTSTSTCRGCRDAAEGEVLGDGQVRATAQQCLHLQQRPQASRDPDTPTAHCSHFSRRPFGTSATPQFLPSLVRSTLPLKTNFIRKISGSNFLNFHTPHPPYFTPTQPCLRILSQQDDSSQEILAPLP